MAVSLDYVQEGDRPYVLFRLLYARNTPLGHGRSDGFNAHGSLVPKDKWSQLCPRAVDQHLSWTSVPTPVLSFYSSWTRIEGFRQWLRTNGATEISIVAIDTSRVHSILNAFQIANQLGYRNGRPDRRRQLDHHLDEYLVDGGIAADSYAVLMILEGMTLHVDTSWETLEEEMYMRTGVVDYVTLRSLYEAIHGVDP